MLAVDTNVLVRALTQDNAAQAKRAGALLRRESIWLAKTVLLETEWVLRRLYGFDRQQIAGALRTLAGLPNVRLEDPVAIVNALDWVDEGLDFADALHLASRGSSDTFATFDTTLCQRATKVAGIKMRCL